MNGKEMKTVESATHLGIQRAGTLSNTSELNIDENLKRKKKS